MPDVTHCDCKLLADARAVLRIPVRPRMRGWSRGARADRKMRRHEIAQRRAAQAAVYEMERRIRTGLSTKGRPRIRFKLWGNWCGPNYGSGKPIGPLDHACKCHDNCYKRAHGEPVVD